MTLPLAAGTEIAAPRSGIHLGHGAAGPVTLRAFRPAGTRIVSVSSITAVQLLVLRAAGAGVRVRVLSGRPRLWAPLVSSGPDAEVIAPGTALPPPGGPSLIVDDRPDETRGVGEPVVWRCRIDVRTPSRPTELRALTQADMLLIGGVAPELAAVATTSLGIAVPHLGQLTSPAQGTVSVLRRGGVDYVTLDPTQEEIRVLNSAG